MVNVRVACYEVSQAVSGDTNQDLNNNSTGYFHKRQPKLSTTKQKALLSTASLLALSACGDEFSVKVTDGLDLSGTADLLGRALEFQNQDAELTLSAAQNEAMQILADGATNGNQTIYVDEPDTFTGDPNIEHYKITPSSQMTLGALGQDVTEVVDPTDAVSTLIFGTGAYSGTFSGFGADDILQPGAGTDLSGTSGLDAGILDFQDQTIEITLDAAQNGSMTISADGGDAGSQTIFVNEIDTFTGDANIETYKITSGSEMTLGSATQNVTETGTEADSTLIFGAETYTGTYTGFDDTDVLQITGDADLSGATSLNNGVLTFGDQSRTITLNAAQNGSLSILSDEADTGLQKIIVDEVDTFTGDANIEAYDITAGSTMTLGTLTQDVTEIGDEAVSTLIFGAGSYTATYSGFDEDDILQFVDDADLSGATGLDAGVLDFEDQSRTITLDAAQNGSLSILATGADTGTQHIIVDEVDTFTGDANIETYDVVATSVMTIGAAGQNVTETGTEGDSTLVFGNAVYTGTFTDFEATDILQVQDGANISGATGLDAGVVDFADGDGVNATMSIAQHAAMTVTNTTNTQSITLSDAGHIDAKAGIEGYTLADVGGSTFSPVAGTEVTVTSGTGDDQITTGVTDAERDELTADFSSGGNDTIVILNDSGSLDISGLVATDFGGFGGTDTGAFYNDGTLLDTATDWNDLNGSQGGATYVEIDGFTATATDGGIDTVKLEQYTGGYVGGVNGTTTNLAGSASGSIFEINTDSFTVSPNQVGNLQSIATFLDTLSNVNDGEYYVIAYSGNDTNADAALYYARATEGDGFDFADSNGATGGYDTDSVELLAVFHEVGANEFSALNFDHVVI